MSPDHDRRVYALFDAALRRDPAGRSALLNEQCAGDRQLRSEVERLLAWDAEAEREGFLEHANPSKAGPTERWSVREGSRRLGRFEVIEAIGFGAFGTVYRARDPQLDRTVAIKVPRAGSLDAEADRDRFLREARSVARLRHPAIVPVHEVGEDDALPFLVSDFVRGVTLAELLKARRPSPHEAARLVAEVADALQYAHEQGVVHRDVKPSNILLDEAGRPHLTDFGLARRDAGEVTLTLAGQVLGTPAYMSPEQARGEAYQVDGRTDVYSLGVILYELSSGERPFRGETRNMLHQVQHDEPRPLRKLNGRLPRDLETICARAMAKEPARRYASAGDLAADLRRFLGGETIRARPSGIVETGWRWCRRRPLVAGLSAAVMLAVLGGVVGTGLAWLAARDAHRDALVRERDATAAHDRERAQAELAMQRLYDVRMTQVERHWEDYNGRLVRQTLDDLLPQNRLGIDRRGFEWYYWRRKFLAGQASLETLGMPVTSVAFSPDGRRIAGVAPSGRTIRIWNVGTGRELHPLTGHTGGVSSVAYSPVGRRVASAGEDGTVRVWDEATGRQVATLEGHADRVMGVAFSPGGDVVASASDDRTVRLWHVADGRVIRTLRGHTGPAWSVAFSPDGRRLASGSAVQGTVKVWDVTDGRELLSLNGHTGGDRSVAWSPDGRFIASAGFLNTVQVWNATTGQEAFTLRGHTDHVQSVAYSPDGRFVASASDDGMVKVWDTATGQEAFTLKGHARWARSVAFSPDGIAVAAGSLDGELRVWDVSHPPGELTRIEPASEVQGMALSPDSRLVAFGTTRGTVNLWRFAGAGESVALRPHEAAANDGVTAVAFSPDGRLVASAHHSGKVRMWDVAMRREVFALTGHGRGASGVAFQPDGDRLASAGLDGTIRLWDVTTGRESLTLRGRLGGSACGLAFSPGIASVASAGVDGTLVLWDTKSGQIARTLRASTRDSVEAVAFSPRGRLVAAASFDSTVQVWDLTNGRLAFNLAGHGKRVSGVAFSPDGRRMVTSSDDGTIKLWDVATGQETLTLKGHARVSAVAFSPDGHWLASAGGPLVKVWDGRPRDIEQPRRAGPWR